MRPCPTTLLVLMAVSCIVFAATTPLSEDQAPPETTATNVKNVQLSSKPPLGIGEGAHVEIDGPPQQAYDDGKDWVDNSARSPPPLPPLDAPDFVCEMAVMSRKLKQREMPTLDDLKSWWGKLKSYVNSQSDAKAAYKALQNWREEGTDDFMIERCADRYRS